MLENFSRNRPSRIGFWKALPLWSRAYFYTGVFAFFASIGFISLLMTTVRLAPLRIVLTVLIMGGFAILYALVSIYRKFWLIAVMGVVEGLLFGFLNGHYRHAERLVEHNSPLTGQLSWIGLAAIISIVAGYALFVIFLSQQGARVFRARNEIAMAAEIHRALVPQFHRTIGTFEVFGASYPSGEVGGDLVDVAGDEHGWTGYLADISGHGVSAGLLMAMFKTAVRTQTSGASSESLLNDVHRALYPLKPPNMFATVGVLQYTGDHGFTLSLAGHPPLLHYSRRTGEVREYPTIDLPLGILPEQTFQSTKITSEPGDVLVLLTDGMTEVFDKQGKELGVEPIKSALAKSAAKPLPDLFSALRQVALQAGSQDDDQTALIVRCMA